MPRGGDPTHDIMSLPDRPNGFTNPEECWICDPKCFQLDLEYLRWWLRPSSVFPLVTTGNFDDAVPGALGQDGTAILLGGSLRNQGHTGFRVSSTYWICPSPAISLESNFFILEQRSMIRTFSSSGATNSQVLSRPYLNAATGLEDADPVALPNVLSGTVSASLRDRFMGAEANVRIGTPCSGEWTNPFSMLVGIRYLNLSERVLIQQSTQDLPLGDPFTVSIDLSDDFSAFNRFVGAQLGCEMRYQWGIFDLSVQGKVGFGQNRQVVQIRGRTLLTEQDTGLQFEDNDQGLLVQPTNVGRYTQNRFSFVPELAANVGVNLTDKIRVHAGYTLLYWTNVARASEQIDRNVNIQPLLLPPGDIFPPAVPVFQFRDTSFWAQGLNVGLAFTY